VGEAAPLALAVHLDGNSLSPRRSPRVTHYVVHNIMGLMLSTGLC
jgi:hypothetical protein